MYKEKVLEEMRNVFADSPYMVEHTFKVLGYAEDIMEGEAVNKDKRELIALVAILHDIGIPEAQKKHGSAAAPYQEKEGEIISRQILEKIGYPQNSTDRISYIVGYHHTASKIDGLDFQIQWEADLLVNLEDMEVRNDRLKLKAVIDENFKTNTGRKLAYRLFLQDQP